MADARIEEIRQLLPRTMLRDWVRLGSRLVRLLRDHHHRGQHDAVLERLLQEARASAQTRIDRCENLPLVSYPPDLPICASKEQIVQTIRTRQVVVIAGETGSGKTTQIPKMCLEAGLGIEAQIGCTQPRRVAALSISRRIAEELNVPWGRQVGCKIRFDDRSSPDTYIKVMTDGILLAETQGDPLLSAYNALIIDEAHERSLNIDFLLGYLKGLLAKRPELKLIITSATIDTEAFSRAFDNAPVIEVSGRLYPVEVRYAPVDSASEELGETTYIDAAVAAAEVSAAESATGDILIFMPGERDIREASDLLRARFSDSVEVIPLFGRLSSGDQQRVFAPSSRRKVVVATNIAETSLTIPGIRYVIDSGLARISRYNPRTRIKRLPVEPVSQSSANQRKGRSGRVQNGVCVRLYSEADFAERPLFTQPEIQRANLAEVILRMKAFRLGEIESFPFLNPPTPAAIQSGYMLLHELGALDENRELTPLGRDLAHLPIDPTLGRMLLQAQKEHATRELLIIAAGLSIQDPRERPMDQKDAAGVAHKRFVDPQSDFLTLLNIWNAVHDEWESLRTQNQRRKFCRSNYLSYVRMREWQDLHAQLHDALEELGKVGWNESNAAYAAIHRSILSGLLGHVAQRTERNIYKGAGNRNLMLFPGSALYSRAEPVKPREKRAQTPAPAGSGQPEWIVAGEVVETSQLFARTVAGVDPLWIVDLAPHLVKITYHNPHWSPEAGRVLVEEKITLHGLEVHHRKAAYANINSKHATEIFIRGALVEENLVPEPQTPARDKSAAKPTSRSLLESAAPAEAVLPAAYRFIEENRKVRQKIETWQTRMRRHDLVDLDESLFAFYSSKIENISSLHELNRLLRDKPDASFLLVSEQELSGGVSVGYDTQAFPDAVPLAGQNVSLSYAYQPGEEHDGVTFTMEHHLARVVPPAALEWAIPGLREPQISELLRALPKSLRRELMPFPPKVQEIVRELRPGASSLLHDLSRFIRERYGVEVPVSAWPAGALPAHLRPRVQVLGPAGKEVAVGRDLAELKRQLEAAKSPTSTELSQPTWTAAAEKIERFGITQWNIGEIPQRMIVADSPAGPVYGWPGLDLEDGQVNLRLFRTEPDAARAALPALQKLVELALQRELAWLQKDLRCLAKLQPLLSGLCSVEDLQQSAFEHLRRYILPSNPLLSLSPAQFQSAVETARLRIPGLAMSMPGLLEPILKLRQEVVRRCGPVLPRHPSPQARVISDLKQLAVKTPAPPSGAVSPASPVLRRLESLVPPDFLTRIGHERLPHVARYLKALLLRAERALVNPAKDREREAKVVPYEDAFRQLSATQGLSRSAAAMIGSFRWMLEEFRVSVFAQEVGTAFPVSEKRLEAELVKIRSEIGL